jgi:hypothetical protein
MVAARSAGNVSTRTCELNGLHCPEVKDRSNRHFDVPDQHHRTRAKAGSIACSPDTVPTRNAAFSSWDCARRMRSCARSRVIEAQERAGRAELQNEDELRHQRGEVAALDCDDACMQTRAHRRGSSALRMEKTHKHERCNSSTERSWKAHCGKSSLAPALSICCCGLMESITGLS